MVGGELTESIVAQGSGIEGWPISSDRARWVPGTGAIHKLAGLGAFVALWYAMTLWAGPRVVPPLHDVIAADLRLLGSPNFWGELGATLASTVTSAFIVLAIGVPLGAVLGVSPFLRASTELIVEFMRTIPPVAIIPLALLLFGPVLQMKLMVIVLGAIWPILLHTIYAVRDIDAVHRDLVTVFTVPRVVAWRGVFIPAMLPSIALGLKVSLTVALLISIACEIVGGAPGLGAGLLRSQLYNDPVGSYAYILAAASLGVVVNLLTSKMIDLVIGRRGKKAT